MNRFYCILELTFGVCMGGKTVKHLLKNLRKFLVFYYPSGKLRQEGNYHDGVPHGLWLMYADNGVVLQEGEYREGLEEGLWKFFDEDGKPTYEGSYQEGERVGVWYYFNRKGEKKKWKNFD